MHEFDEIKKEFYQVIAAKMKVNPKDINMLKSADALYFTENNKLLIVEMKKIKDELDMKIFDKLDELLANDGVPRKMTDSLQLILSICAHYDYDNAVYEGLLKRCNSDIYPMLLTDMTHEQYTVSYHNYRNSNRKVSITAGILENKIAVYNCHFFSIELHKIIKQSSTKS